MLRFESDDRLHMRNVVFKNDLQKKKDFTNCFGENSCNFKSVKCDLQNLRLL